MESIFIQLPSYNDHELPNTIEDVLNSASGNYKINIASYIVLYKDEHVNIKEYPNVKYKIDQAPTGIGIGYARLQSHNFYDGEDYYLQIDSHSKMNKNWDEQIVSYIKDYKKMGFEKPLITNYPRNYWYENGQTVIKDTGDRITQISFKENVKQFNDIRIPTQTAVDNKYDNIFSNSVSGGSIFTVGDFLTPNPRIAFYGEEIFTAARAYTMGYDLLIPKKQFMYHLYFDHSKPMQNKRRLVWQDWPEEFDLMDRLSKEEIYKTFTKSIIGSEHLGKERSLNEYGDFIGLNFKTGEVLETCYDYPVMV